MQSKKVTRKWISKVINTFVLQDGGIDLSQMAFIVTTRDGKDFTALGSTSCQTVREMHQARLQHDGFAQLAQNMVSQLNAEITMFKEESSFPGLIR